MHNPEKTAIHRKKPSAPIQALAKIDAFSAVGRGRRPVVLDFGAGRGADLDFLMTQNGSDAYGWDPNFVYNMVSPHKRPGPMHIQAVQQKNDMPNQKFDVITCTYVLNVLPPNEREKAINDVRELLSSVGVAYFTVRGHKDRVTGIPFEDGVLTSKKTFQRTFTANQLLEQIPGSLLVFDTPNYVTVRIPAKT